MQWRRNPFDGMSPYVNNILTQFSVSSRWMNKMGLAAIVFDASDVETTAGFVRRGLLPSQSSQGGSLTLTLVAS